MASVRSAGIAGLEFEEAAVQFACARSGSGATVSPVRISGGGRFRSLSVGGGGRRLRGERRERRERKRDRGDERAAHGGASCGVGGRRLPGRRAVVDRRERVARLHRVFVEALALLFELARSRCPRGAGLLRLGGVDAHARAPSTRGETSVPTRDAERGIALGRAFARARPEAVSRVRAS